MVYKAYVHNLLTILFLWEEKMSLHCTVIVFEYPKVSHYDGQMFCFSWRLVNAWRDYCLNSQKVGICILWANLRENKMGDLFHYVVPLPPQAFIFLIILCIKSFHYAPFIPFGIFNIFFFLWLIWKTFIAMSSNLLFFSLKV